LTLSYHKLMKPRPTQPFHVTPEELSPRVLLASFMIVPPGSRFHGFPVPGVNIYLVTGGQMRFRKEGGAFSTARPGGLVTFHQGRHAYEAAGTESLSIYQTHFLAASPPRRSGIPVLPGIGQLPDLLNVRARMPEFVAIFHRMMQVLVDRTVAWEIESAACALDLLQLAFKVAAGSAQKEKQTLSPWDSLVARLETDEENMSVHEMATILGYSPEHFIREFKKRYGLPPKQYVQSHRLDRARRMILDGSNVKTAAAACGFSSALHLNRTHKRYYKAPPSAAKRMFTAEMGSVAIRPGLPVSRHIWAPGVDITRLAAWLQKDRRSCRR
jgi:AraC-like DNA-binding protein